MLKTLSFDKWAVYGEFADTVNRWQASFGESAPKEGLKEKWDITTLRSFDVQGKLDSGKLEIMERFYKVLGLPENQAFLTLYTKNGVWTQNQVYAPIVQMGAEGLVIKVDGLFIPLTIASSNNDGVPSIVIKAQLNGAWKAVRVQSKSRSFKDAYGKDFSVERLNLMLPVTEDNLCLVEIPFHPKLDYMKSSGIANAYFTGNLDYFRSTLEAELSVAKAGDGGGGGPMADLNKIFRKVWPKVIQLMTRSDGSLEPLLLKFTEWRLVEGERILYPAYAFRLDPDTKARLVVACQEDWKVECWGEKDEHGLKPHHLMSEIEWIAIGAAKDSVKRLQFVNSQPGHIKVLNPDRNLNNIPNHLVLPISTYTEEKQLKFFKMVYQPTAALPPAPTQVESGNPASTETVPVTAEEIF